jgi:hypothetical protein
MYFGRGSKGRGNKAVGLVVTYCPSPFCGLSFSHWHYMAGKKVNRKCCHLTNFAKKENKKKIVKL